MSIGRNDIGKLLESLKLTGFGVEIGVEHGLYSKVLLSTTKLNKLYLIDLWETQPVEIYRDMSNSVTQDIQNKRYQDVLGLTKEYPDRVVMMKMDSVVAAKTFDDNFFDFIYIDANHKYEAVKNDISAWYPKLKNNGLFSGHDYLDVINKFGEFGVKRAVDEFCKIVNKTPIITKEKRTPSWYFIK